jgi:hypothetical protein
MGIPGLMSTTLSKPIFGPPLYPGQCPSNVGGRLPKYETASRQSRSLATTGLNRLANLHGSFGLILMLHHLFHHHLHHVHARIHHLHTLSHLVCTQFTHVLAVHGFIHHLHLLLH